jgi:1-acyl-sn-glycerol-3-phosphate acyltransferase
MGSVRLIFRTLLIALGLLVCLLPHYSCVGLGRPSPWPRRFLAWVGRCAGLRVTVLGTPLPSHVLFLANHLSWLDIMAVAGTSGAAFVSKEEVGRWPVVGWLARLNRTVFVARTERTAVRGQADALRTALASGQPVALFPEGTTGGSVSVLPFRASLLASLYPPLPGIRVQPVAIDYGAAGTEIAWVGEEGAGANTRRILSRRGTLPVRLTYLDPIEPAGSTDRKALAALARTRILEALGSAGAPDRL